MEECGSAVTGNPAFDQTTSRRWSKISVVNFTLVIPPNQATDIISAKIDGSPFSRWHQGSIRSRGDAMILRICGLAFILVGFLNSVGSAETPIERDSYLVNTIGAFGNCHARDTLATRTTELAHGFGQTPAIVSRNITRSRAAPEVATAIMWQSMYARGRIESPTNISGCR